MSHDPSLAQANATRWHGLPSPSLERRSSVPAGSFERLHAWFNGDLALTRAQAHQLLESALKSGYIQRHHGEFVAAVKALAAGPSVWQDMGYRLLPDDSS